MLSRLKLLLFAGFLLNRPYEDLMACRANDLQISKIFDSALNEHKT